MNKKKQLFTKRFFPAGTYIWTVPPGCVRVDVFLVGGGAGGNYHTGGAGGFTKTYKGQGYVKPQNGTWDGGRDGNSIAVVPGQTISVVVGAGGIGYKGYPYRADATDGGKSSFGEYECLGGYTTYSVEDHTPNPTGGSAGSCYGARGVSNQSPGGTDGGDSLNGAYLKQWGQGHTTRDWGEPSGKRNAAGGGNSVADNDIGYNSPGVSDYSEGSGYGGRHNMGSSAGGGGYGGGGGASFRSDSEYERTYTGNGGDGTVLIRYWAYEE